MTVELRPLGITCNIACHYCYQNPQREAGNFHQPYDLVRMQETLEKYNRPFSLFGGEPLLMPIDDLEKIWRWGFEKYRQNSIQTNGVLITDRHIDLFKQYNVQVGISIDGPVELNDTRWNHTLEKTREATDKTERNIERLAREWLAPALIVTLHKGNAQTEFLPVMAEWFRKLDRLGVKSVRLHLLEVDSPFVRQRYALSEKENVEAILFFAKLQSELHGLHFDIIDEMTQLLLGKDKNTSCVWHACDPYTTSAVQGVEGNGQSSNCGRVSKDGVSFTKADESGYERYLMLYQLPQEFGGCRDCRFFLMCKGQCPGTAINGDWRNRTEHCDIWKDLFSHIEEKLIQDGFTPLSIRSERKLMEAELIDRWSRGINDTLEFVLNTVRAA